MTYRRLSSEELAGLEKSFVHYLAVNGLDKEAWEQIKKKDPNEVEKHICLFSDLTFEKVCSEVSFLSFFSKNQIFCFHFRTSTISLVGLENKKGFSLDLNTATIKELLAADLDNIGFVKQEKPYVSSKQKEVFELLENGAKIDDGYLYKQLLLAITD